MAAAVASASIPASTMVLGSPLIDARLNLSLDDLIKERRKETKKEVQQQKKRESVKQEQASPAKKADAQQQKKMATANAQSEKRKNKMNKNRSLPAVQPQTQQQTKKQNGNNQNASSNGPSKAAKKLLRKKAKKAAAVAAGRDTLSPKAKQQPLQQQKFKNRSADSKRNGNNSPSQKNTKQQQQFKQFKQFKSTLPTVSPKQQMKKTMTFTVKPAKGMRAVNKTAKGSKLQITLVRSDADLRRTKKQKQFETQRQTVAVPAKKKMNAKAAKALLPGKAQPKTRKVLAQTLVNQAKRSVASRKQWTSKNGKFIVRKPVMVRRA